MGKLIMVSSVTYAIKGRELLKAHGIKAVVERTPRQSAKQGCGYSLYVPQLTDEAESILKENGIKVTGRAERRNGT